MRILFVLSTCDRLSNFNRRTTPTQSDCRKKNYICVKHVSNTLNLEFLYKAVNTSAKTLNTLLPESCHRSATLLLPPTQTPITSEQHLPDANEKSGLRLYAAGSQ
jgi:hypothetical protein